LYLKRRYRTWGYIYACHATLHPNFLLLPIASVIVSRERLASLHSFRLWCNGYCLLEWSLHVFRIAFASPIHLFSLTHSSVFLHIGSDPFLRMPVRIVPPSLFIPLALSRFIVLFTFPYSSFSFFFLNRAFHEGHSWVLHASKVKIKCCVISLCTTSPTPHTLHFTYSFPPS